MLPDLSDPAVRRLVVTGHPNHELAIFGLVQRVRPRLLFLTDGGGEARIGESQRALAAIGAQDRAKFLRWREQTLYDALLERDAAVLHRLAAAVRAELIAFAPRQVFCESIELYNPLHDITLPIVRAAAAGLPGIELVEFPLIAQEPLPDEQYRVQRFPAHRASTAIALDSAELDRKLHARDHIYDSLRRSTGAVMQVSRERAGTEVFARASESLPVPGEDHDLRYERRARLLHARGDIERMITFSSHFVPAVAALQSWSA